MVSNSSRLWDRFEDASHDNGMQMTSISNDAITALEAAEKRIAELELRTVTVGNLQESAYRAGLTAGWNLGLANNNDGFNKCLAAHAAGIKVEAE
ncbi:hypothetical protein [Klebsiella pneumoniae]|uniref:hypothetical protein n=1 Tax=Klebsiella pneumoniae TaxID=573 RepID=UPI00217ED382|nr:hypothetical protein [Klebsiella pneumoniae]MCS6661736.1 hypothetical protein [Klebsiella pneumoniae subsp. pneumoniae]